MEMLVIIIVLTALVILLIFVILLFIFMVDSMVRGHDLPTSRRATKAITKIISEHTPNKNFYDLGVHTVHFRSELKRNYHIFQCMQLITIRYGYFSPK